MAMYLHNKFKELLMDGDIDLEAANLKIMALNTYTIAPNTQDAISSVSANQITATGYTAGGQALAGKSNIRNNTDGRVYFDFNDPSWTITGTMTAQVFVVYLDSGTAATSWIVCTIDKGSPQSRTDTNYVLQLNAKGLFGL